MSVGSFGGVARGGRTAAVYDVSGLWLEGDGFGVCHRGFVGVMAVVVAVVLFLELGEGWGGMEG